MKDFFVVYEDRAKRHRKSMEFVHYATLFIYSTLFFCFHLNLVLRQQALQLGKVFLRHACPQPALPVHFLFQNLCSGALAVVIEGAHLGVVSGGAEDDLGNQCFQFGRLQSGAGAFFISFDEPAGAKQNPAEVAHHNR